LLFLFLPYAPRIDRSLRATGQFYKTLPAFYFTKHFFLFVIIIQLHISALCALCARDNRFESVDYFWGRREQSWYRTHEEEGKVFYKHASASKNFFEIFAC